MTAPSRWRAILGAVVLSVSVPVALAGCTSARNGLGTPVDTCYRALPVAADALHHRGAFGGVVLLGPRALRPTHPLGRLVAGRTGPSVRSVCVVAFRGAFDRGDVQAPLGTSTGTERWALVVVSTPANRLVGTLLLSRPPFALDGLL